MLPVLLQLGSFRIASYGTFFVLSLGLGYLLARRQGRLDGFSTQTMESMWLWTMGLAMLGGRFLFTFVEHASVYWAHPLRFFEVDSGGFSALGSFYFMAVGVPLLCRWKKLPFWKMADALAPPLVLALCVGKVGCFMAGCCNGLPTALPWAVSFVHPLSLANPKGVPVHPVQLYEASTWLLLCGGLGALRARRHFPGEVGLGFFLGFAVLRALLEPFRADSTYFGPLTSYQWLAIPLGAAALIGMGLLRRRGQPGRLANLEEPGDRHPQLE